MPCPCYLHRCPPIDGCLCICECDHAPCGHPTTVTGCGGCDPSAIDYELAAASENSLPPGTTNGE